jgi:hypothetical protein
VEVVILWREGATRTNVRAATATSWDGIWGVVLLPGGGLEGGVVVECVW